MAAPSDLIPADNFPVPGEYDGTEDAGNLDYPTVGPRAPINYRELEQIGGGGGDPGYQLSSGNLDHPTVSTTLASIMSNNRKRLEYILATGGGDSDSLGVQLSSGGTGNLDHPAISTTPASIRSSALSNDLEMGEYLQPIGGGGGFGSDWAQLRSGGTGNLDHRGMSATPVSIRPRAPGNYQEMVDYISPIRGGSLGDSYLHDLQSDAQSYQLSCGGTGNLDDPMISAVPASITTTAVRAHLEKLGYLQPFDGGCDDILSFESAVKRYQLNHDLEATGFIDGPTALVMSSRLCGVPDIVGGMNLTRLHGSGASCLTLHSGGVRKWDRFVLFYKFESNFPAEAKPAFRRALEEWTGNSPFHFLESPRAGAVDILVGFYSGKHGDCPSSFNGPGGAVAHSFYPPDGRLHFDEIQPWSFRNHCGDFVDMETAALHEIGHVLGLSHSSDKNSVMYCGVAANQIKRRLTTDDIEAIRSLYP